jgi:hypothetical protein
MTDEADPSDDGHAWIVFLVAAMAAGGAVVAGIYFLRGGKLPW